MIRRTFGPGAMIFYEGEPAECAYLIERGQVEICSRRHGRVITLAMLGKGEIFGEMGVIDDQVRSATAVALEETEVLVIQRDQIRRRLDHAEPVIGMLLRTVLSRFRASQNILLSELPGTAARDSRLVLSSTEPPAMSDTANAFEWLVREQDLRRGILADEFEPFLQPIVDLQTSHLVGFEALVRWRHPERGFVPPGEFINLGERSGLIRDLDRCMLRKSCQALRDSLATVRSEAPCRSGLFLSVNLSPHHFIDDAIVDCLTAITAETGFEPTCLKAEITESVLISDPQRAFRVLSRIKDMGITIALDDFGTGYSSLSYLLHFPIDILKIDQHFVRHLGDGSVNQEIVKAITTLAQAMNLTVVAEGVETAALVPPLLDLGCSLGQGYHFGRPVPACDLIDLLRHSGPLPVSVSAAAL